MVFGLAFAYSKDRDSIWAVTDTMTGEAFVAFTARKKPGDIVQAFKAFYPEARPGAEGEFVNAKILAPTTIPFVRKIIGRCPEETATPARAFWYRVHAD